MTTGFIPHTQEERSLMLQRIGVKSIEDLFAQVPSELGKSCNSNTLSLTGRNELELEQHLVLSALKNSGAPLECFLGGGAYSRFIPSVVNAIASRSEFYTAYTPYQPEVSQGTLQMIYEFQTMMSELTEMAVTNASVYDGATALGESVMMAVRATRRNVIYLSKTLNPHYQKVLETYVNALEEIELRYFDTDQPLAGQIAEDAKNVAAVAVQQPDYFGMINSLEDCRSFCKESGALMVVSVDPVTLSVLEAPGAWGADIVCGDIQQFGNSLNYGGPYGGFISTTDKLVRQIPGRIVGRTRDKEGNTAYTLTLQTREQHIRREKATSNICTNQSLNILKASIYLSLLGPTGLRQIAEVSSQRAHELAGSILCLPGVSLRFEKPFLYEFALSLPLPASIVVQQMIQRHGILAGIDLGKYWHDEDRTLLVAVTEMNSPESLKRYVDAFRDILRHNGLSLISKNPDRCSDLLATGTLGRES